MLDFEAINEFRVSVREKDVRRARNALVQTKKRMKSKPALKSQVKKLEIWVIEARIEELEGLGDPDDFSDEDLVHYVKDFELEGLIWDVEHCLNADFTERIGKAKRILERLSEEREECKKELEELAQTSPEESVLEAAVERAMILDMRSLEAAIKIEKLLERIQVLKAQLTDFLAASAAQSQLQVRHIWDLLEEAEKIGMDPNLLRQASRRARRMMKLPTGTEGVSTQKL